ncbi:O-linked N-acetylglucosamine transferase family protein [Azospirillum sp. sgz302134]
MDAVAQAVALENAGRLAEAEGVCRKALQADPENPVLLHRLGLVVHRLGRPGEAAALFQKSLAIRKDLDVALDFGAVLAAISHWQGAVTVYGAALRLAPDSIDARYGLALAHHMQGRAAEAEAHYRAVLAARPDLGPVHDNLGLTLQAQGRFAEAVAAHREAARLSPADAGAWNNLGTALQQAGQPAEAEAAHRKAIGLDAEHASACYNLACLFQVTGRLAEATAAARRMAVLDPADAQAWLALGNAAHAAARWDEALCANARAVRLAPSDPGARNNLANALSEAGRLAEAVAEYRALLALQPDFPVAEINLAQALRGQRDTDGALAVLRALIARHPLDAEAWRSAGLALMDAFRPDAGAEALRRAVALAPGEPHLSLELGAAATLAEQTAPSIAAYRHVLRLAPGHDAALAHLVQQQKHACDWRDLPALEHRLVERVRAGAEGVPPFCLLAGESTLADQRLAAGRWARLKGWGVPPVGTVPAAPTDSQIRDGRLRIGYLSADFHEHATAYLMAEQLEQHDRARFAVTAYSTGIDDGSPMRRRLVNAVERFVDLRGRSDADAAQMIAADGIDILVDLKGYTAFARTPILAARPAPVQVNWLGYPGTMGAPYIDYVLADPVVIPPGEETLYSEAVVRLPHCYQPNDRRRAIAERTPSRADCGLPAEGFVFCCFNSPYKLTPAQFDLWARLLRAVPGSVLWLYAPTALVAGNLRREGEARGLAPDRLVFAPPRPLPDHLARHRLADLFLDTLPYNAHTTASDALWAGLPVLTCRGATFAGRVAASLLHALDLPELVTETPAHYEATALALARDPARLGALRDRLAAARTTAPLFDTPRFTRHLEAAYRAMWDIHRAGGAPRAIDIPAD